MKQKQKINVVLVDDHVLIRKGISELINNFGSYTVIWDASNGQEFVNKLKTKQKPDIVVLDIAMPLMDGYETAVFLKKNYPEIKILVLSMLDDEDVIIKMVKIGINGYILKDASPLEFKTTLDEIVEKGCSFAGYVSETMAKNLESNNNVPINIKLSPREKQFLELICCDLTYKEIAEKLDVSIRTVDNYRDSLLDKLNVKTKISIVVYAMKNGYYKAL